MNSISATGLPWKWGSIEGIDTPAHVRDGDSDREGPRWRLASRAVETSATPESLFLWICQLRRTPYSYDWIDNLGRPSPRTPDPALIELAAGQPVMEMFRLVEFVPDRSITIEVQRGCPARVFGYILVRYAAVPLDADRSLLRCDFWMPRTGGPVGWLRRYLLAWGDLVMMRKQLRTLSQLAEQTDAARQ